MNITINLAATLFMTGVIWFVQLVHYPLFDRVDRLGFPHFEAEHQSRTTLVVMPAMLIELAAAIWLVVARPTMVAPWEAWLALALVVVIWASTALLQVPQHQRLATGFDAKSHQFLVASNWVRTIAWSLRSLILLKLVAMK